MRILSSIWFWLAVAFCIGAWLALTGRSPIGLVGAVFGR